jgi:hypothetical protein
VKSAPAEALRFATSILPGCLPHFNHDQRLAERSYLLGIDAIAMNASQASRMVGGYRIETIMVKQSCWQKIQQESDL